MAYTRVTNTKSGAAAIRYAYEEPSHKAGMERVLASSGSNLDPRFAMQQMRATWDAFGKNDGKTVQMYRIVQSFGLDELDPNNPEDVAKANAIGLEFASEMYPDRQALIVTQADGEGGKLHNHILVNSVSFVDGKSLRGERTRWEHISAKSDEIIKRHGLEPLKSKKAKNKTTIAERKLDEQGKYVWKSDLKGRIEVVLGDESVTSRDAFIERMRDDFGVDVRFRGKGISYSFTDDEGKKRVIRSSRLGEDYGKENIENVFAKNKSQQATRSSSSVIDIGIDFESELQAIRRAHKPKAKARKPKKSNPLLEAFMRERDAKKQAEEERKEQERLAREQQELERIRQEEQAERERERLKRERQEQQEREEQARKEREEKQRQAERERQIQLQREQAKRRIQKATSAYTKVTPELIDEFLTQAKELEGKTKGTVTGKRVPYDDLDIYQKAKHRLQNKGKEQGQRQSQIAVQQAEQDMGGPEL